MSAMVKLAHWAPKSRRHSIRREGLRRCSWSGTQLILWAIDRAHAHELRVHVADRHSCPPDALDLWIFQLPAALVRTSAADLVLVCEDIPPSKLSRSKPRRAKKGGAA